VAHVKITLKDIAAVTGLSESTVSRALNDMPTVSQETKLRVRAAMERLQQRLQGTAPSAPALPGQDGALIGFFVSEALAATGIRASAAYQAELAGIQEAAERYGTSVVLGTYSDSEGPEPLTAGEQLLATGRLAGAILSGVTAQSSLLRIRQSGVPFVAVGTLRDDVACVGVDDQEIGLNVARHLLELGHRQIACLSGPQQSAAFRGRVQGFQAALKEAGVKEPAALVGYCDLDVVSASEAAWQLLAHRPTAIWAADDRVALAVLQVARELGLRVTDDLSVLGCDDSEEALLGQPPLTTVRVPRAAMARHAVDLLFQLLRAPEVDSSRIKLRTELVTRRSVATAPPK
jgi:LacI family transcriptional regulator